MGLARKCDRCGILFENYFGYDGTPLYNGIRKIRTSRSGDVVASDVYKDLCIDCITEYERFMAGYGVSEILEVTNNGRHI